ncbi:MAG: TrkA family potassium uptake protein [Spirochaetales bacterium]|nr:TrkA family potassium uptake protein [Spirochaetales bacterium]MBR2316439.1 TrkA family potassium uptake protein [Spirochaetales bacterium]
MAQNKVITIIGLGTFGIALCKELAKSNDVYVIAIDKSEKQIEQIKEFVAQAIQMNSTEEDSFKDLPLNTIDTAIVAMATDIESSILTTAILKKNNISNIIARATSSIHASILQKVGATEVINVEADGGKRLASRLISPDIMEQVQISGELVLTELPLPRAFFGKKLIELNLRSKYNINVVCIKRKIHDIDRFDNPMVREEVLFPRPDDKLNEGDFLMVIGRNDDINILREL